MASGKTAGRQPEKGRTTSKLVHVHGKGNLSAKAKGEVIAEILAAIRERMA